MHYPEGVSRRFLFDTSNLPKKVFTARAIIDKLGTRRDVRSSFLGCHRSTPHTRRKTAWRAIPLHNVLISTSNPREGLRFVVGLNRNHRPGKEQAPPLIDDLLGHTSPPQRTRKRTASLNTLNKVNVSRCFADLQQGNLLVKPHSPMSKLKRLIVKPDQSQIVQKTSRVQGLLPHYPHPEHISGNSPSSPFVESTMWRTIPKDKFADTFEAKKVDHHLERCFRQRGHPASLIRGPRLYSAP